MTETACSKFPHPNPVDEWTIYLGNWCGFCRRTVKYFKDKDVQPVYWDVDKIEGGKEKVYEKLSQVTDNYKTIPIIFNRDKFIGGYTDLIEKMSH